MFINEFKIDAFTVVNEESREYMFNVYKNTDEKLNSKMLCTLYIDEKRFDFYIELKENKIGNYYYDYLISDFHYSICYNDRECEEFNMFDTHKDFEKIMNNFITDLEVEYLNIFNEFR